MLPVSEDVKVKLALVLLVNAAGFPVIVVTGGVVSIVQEKLAGVESVLPAASVARTWKM